MEAPTSPPSPPPVRGRSWRPTRGADGVLGGVCRGYAVAAGIDVSVVRLAFVLAALAGPGLLAYLVLWVVVPKEGTSGRTNVEPAPEDVATGLRIALAVGGLIGLAGALTSWPFGFGDPFPSGDAGGVLGLALIIGGAVLLLQRRRDHRPPPSAGPPPGGPRTSPSDGPASAATPPPPPWDPPRVDLPALPLAPPGGIDAPVDAPVDVPDDGSTAGAPAAPVAGASASRRALDVGSWVVAVLGTLAGLAVATLVAGGILGLGLPPLVVLLLVGGVALAVATALAGWSGWSLASAVALVLGGLLLATVAGHWRGDLGARTVTVSSPEQLATTYRQAAGALTLDLAEVDVGTAGATVHVDAGVARVDVVVPDDAALVADVHVGIGEGAVPGERAGGVGTRVRTGERVPDGQAGVLRVDVDLRIGAAYVCRASDASNGACEG